MDPSKKTPHWQVFTESEAASVGLAAFEFDELLDQTIEGEDKIKMVKKKKIQPDLRRHPHCLVFDFARIFASETCDVILNTTGICKEKTIHKVTVTWLVPPFENHNNINE